MVILIICTFFSACAKKDSPTEQVHKLNIQIMKLYTEIMEPVYNKTRDGKDAKVSVEEKIQIIINHFSREDVLNRIDDIKLLYEKYNDLIEKNSIKVKDNVDEYIEFLNNFIKYTNSSEEERKFYMINTELEIACMYYESAKSSIEFYDTLE